MSDNQRLATFFGGAIIGLVLGLALAVGTACAEQPPEIGTGLLCDTPAQVEQYLDLVNQGATGQAALAVVNENKTPVACAVAPVAFIREEAIKEKTVKGQVVEITKVTVIGGVQQVEGVNIIQHVPPTPQYTMFRKPGQSI